MTVQSFIKILANRRRAQNVCIAIAAHESIPFADLSQFLGNRKISSILSFWKFDYPSRKASEYGNAISQTQTALCTLCNWMLN